MLQGVARRQELDGPLTNHHMLTVRIAPMGFQIFIDRCEAEE
jgi:hypothetical protein